MGTFKVSDSKPGDVFSEISHYTLKEVKGDNVILNHEEAREEVVFSKKYVEDLLATADQYETTITVGKEDKFWTAKQIEDARKKNLLNADVEVGGLKQKGIKSLFEDIGTSQVFTVCFRKQDRKRTKKEFEELKAKQAADLAEEIAKAKKNKKSVTDAAVKAITILQDNPVLPTEEGELRVLRGYKVEFRSNDGRYDCVDMDLPGNTGNIRPVNINTIQWLVFNGVMYTLEK